MDIIKVIWVPVKRAKQIVKIATIKNLAINVKVNLLSTNRNVFLLVQRKIGIKMITVFVKKKPMEIKWPEKFILISLKKRWKKQDIQKYTTNYFQLKQLMHN